MTTTVKSFYMIRQPIIDVITNEVVTEEYLCRPYGMSVAEYFRCESAEELWAKEKACIEESIRIQGESKKKNINITLSSLPYFLETELTWDGGIEIVEWQMTDTRNIDEMVERLKQRGLNVWVDDITPENWSIWCYSNVTGFKVAFPIISKSLSFLRELQARHKPIMIEEIEQQTHLEFLQNYGLRFAQGFLFDQQVIRNI